MLKRYISLLIILVLLLSVSCSKTPKEKMENKEELTNKDTLKVVTTLFAQYDFAKQVGGDKVDVHLILPAGVEPHSYEPTPKDIVTMKEADFLIYTGDHMEPWVSKIRDSLEASGVTIIDASKGIELLKRQDHEEEHDDHESDADHEQEHHHGDSDPHIWLDFDNAIKMTKTIENAFVLNDSDNKEYYEKNAQEYVRKLKDLDTKYKASRSTFKSNKIFTGGHFAFAYLAERYDLEYESPYKGFSPNAEPSPKDIAKLVDCLKEKDIKAIYYEELVNPKVAKVLSNEAGVEMLLLNALHNVSKEDLEDGKTYIEFMEENLKNLEKGLGNE